MPTSEHSVVRFGVFELDQHSSELRKHGVRIRLQKKPLQILAMLLDRAGEMVTREELRHALWSPDVFVDFDHSLNSAVNKLREALADSATPRFVETLPGGYRFIAPIFPPAKDQAPAIEQTRVATPAGAARWRPQTAVIASAAILLLFISTIATLRSRTASASKVLGLAVLPFQNLSADLEQSFSATALPRR